jgi:hypothetical protein
MDFDKKEKVNITDGDYKNRQGFVMSRVGLTDWLVTVKMGGGKIKRAVIEERHLKPITKNGR